MTEQTGFSAFIRSKLVEFGWLPQESMVDAESSSPWDTEPTLWWRDLQHHFHQFVESFIHWIHAHIWGRWTRNGQSTVPANELLPGFMETSEARAFVEFDDQRQAWTAHLDFTHHSLTCHLELVNEESAPIMKQILSPRQLEAPPPE